MTKVEGGGVWSCIEVAFWILNIWLLNLDHSSEFRLFYSSKCQHDCKKQKLRVPVE
jgi:hypothetical protein